MELTRETVNVIAEEAEKMPEQGKKVTDGEILDTIEKSTDLVDLRKRFIDVLKSK